MGQAIVKRDQWLCHPINLIELYNSSRIVYIIYYKMYNRDGRGRRRRRAHPIFSYLQNRAVLRRTEQRREILYGEYKTAGPENII